MVYGEWNVIDWAPDGAGRRIVTVYYFQLYSTSHADFMHVQRIKMNGLGLDFVILFKYEQSQETNYIFAKRKKKINKYSVSSGILHVQWTAVNCRPN